ncbi:PAS domain-containing protein [Aurantimonas sp. A2-1-M11]|uniref:PAS domain-containing protein n=1 Tax=Aurantimonas sp. A2-1-M11 TaxID=3113712 RepID=UPI002F9479ED
MSQASAKNVPTARDPSIDRFEWAVDSADLGVWDADLLRNQCFYSDGWNRMLGYGSDVLCDDPDLWLQLIHPDDREKAIASGEQHLAGVTEQIETEFRLRHRDGHYIWVLDRGRAVAWDEDGQPTRLIGVQTNITGQKQLMQDLVLQRQRVELALEVGRIGVWQFEPSTGRTIWDRRMRDIYGLDAGPNEVPQATWHQRLHPDDAKAAEHSAARLLQDGMPVDTTYRIVRPSGEIRHVHALTRRVCLNDGSTLLIGSVFDITERVLRENAVLAEKEFLRNSINAIADGVVIVDREQRITYANNAACHLLQHDCTRVLGTLLSDTMLVVHATNLQPILNIASQALALQSSVSGREDACLLRQDGSVLPISDRASAMFDADGFLIGAITIFQDATEQREHQMSLAYAAEHDHLTGLLNRATFDARLDDIVADLADSTAYGLIFIDLDRFKLVNDTAGHAAGDALLQRIAEVLQSCLPDGALAARLGGDEFAAVVSINDVHTLSQICENIIAQINNARPIWSGRSYDIGCSIGAVMLDSIFRDRQSAMAFADAACYAAKSSGRNKSVIHNSSACSVEEDLADV